MQPNSDIPGLRPLTTPLALIEFLQQSRVQFRRIRHQPTHTSEESAAARGEPLECGAKALLLKVEDTFRLFVLSAASKLDSSAIKRKFAAKSVRFATREELAALTGLVPGSVPPFGRPHLPFDLYLDTRVGETECVAFNAASLTESIVLGGEDYLRVVGESGRFSFAIAADAGT